MPSTQTIIISTLTGALIAGGWWFFIDGAVHAPDAFPWFHIAPAFGIMLSMFMVNLVSPNRMERPSVKLWLFLWFTLGMVCIGVAIWITTVEYPPQYNWPGVTIILQTILVFTAGILFFVGRIQQGKTELFG